MTRPICNLLSNERARIVSCVKLGKLNSCAGVGMEHTSHNIHGATQKPAALPTFVPDDRASNSRSAPKLTPFRTFHAASTCHLRSQTLSSTGKRGPCRLSGKLRFTQGKYIVPALQIYVRTFARKGSLWWSVMCINLQDTYLPRAPSPWKTSQ